MAPKQNTRGIWLLVFYLPISCAVIGLLSYLMRLPVPVTGRRAFSDVFWAYALRFPSDFSVLRWVAPALGWVLLLLMLVAVRTRKPILTLVEIRVVLLVLIVIVTLVAKIFANLIGATPGSARGTVYQGTKNLVTLLFLFVDVDLILVLLASYLRIFKPLRRRLI